MVDSSNTVGACSAEGLISMAAATASVDRAPPRAEAAAAAPPTLPPAPPLEPPVPPVAPNALVLLLLVPASNPPIANSHPFIRFLHFKNKLVSENCRTFKRLSSFLNYSMVLIRFFFKKKACLLLRTVYFFKKGLFPRTTQTFYVHFSIFQIFYGIYSRKGRLRFEIRSRFKFSKERYAILVISMVL